MSEIILSIHTVFDVTGFLVFGLIEIFFIAVWARFDELKGREI